MKKIFILVTILLMNCGILGGKGTNNQDNALLVLALLQQPAAPNCAAFPKRVIWTGHIDLTCSVSGLTLTCTGLNSKIASATAKMIVTYSSVTMAKSGVFDSAGYTSFEGMKASSIVFTDSVLGTNSYSFTYDAQNRVKTISTPTVYAYSNYDSHGFPQQADIQPETVSWTYAGLNIPAAGTYLPSGPGSATTVTYDSNGWATTVDYGAGIIPITNTGVVLMCK